MNTLTKTVISSLFMVGLIGASSVSASTPDGVTPAEETVCSGLKGKLFGICNAYCEAKDCDDPNHTSSNKSCKKLALKFSSFGGGTLPCLEVAQVPKVAIVKLTNNLDVEVGDLMLIVDDPVEWKYIVTNTGDGDLTNIAVSDDQGVVVSCPGGVLAEGASVTCTGNGTVQLGDYMNLGSVSTGEGVSDSDSSSYIGLSKGIMIKKYINDNDANDIPGPSIDKDGTVTIKYVITNTGSADLVNVSVEDVVMLPAVGLGFNPCLDEFGATFSLSGGESKECFHAGDSSVVGQHKDIASASGQTEIGGASVGPETDSGHYMVVEPFLACPCWNDFTATSFLAAFEAVQFEDGESCDISVTKIHVSSNNFEIGGLTSIGARVLDLGAGDFRCQFGGIGVTTRFVFTLSAGEYEACRSELLDLTNSLIASSVSGWANLTGCN